MGGKLRKAMGFAALVACLLVWSGLAAGGAAAAPSKVAWSKCFAQLGPFECGTVQVPLDYDQPNGRKISLALIRLPAADQAHRIGSLFLNPGGPGGSGVDFVLGAGPVLFTDRDEVRARFDLVGFDPRGIARSTALRCFGNAETVGPLLHAVRVPVDARGGADLDRRRPLSRRRLRPARRQHRRAHVDGERRARPRRPAPGGGRRQAVVLRRLVRLLPRRHLREPVPGPGARARRRRRARPDRVGDRRRQRGDRPCRSRRGCSSDVGAQATLEEFFRLCDAGGPACAFGPSSADRFAALATRLKATRSGHAPGRVCARPQLLDSDRDHARRHVRLLVLGGLRAALASIDAQVACGDTGRSRGAFPRRRPVHREARLPALSELPRGIPGRRLRRLRTTRDSYSALVARPARPPTPTGTSARLWTWASSICAAWPFADADRYTGPFTTRRRTRCSSSATCSIRRRATRERDRREPAAELEAADAPRLGTHVAVPLAVRRQRASRATSSTWRSRRRAPSAKQDHVPFTAP